jgi:hypothetical protein
MTRQHVDNIEIFTSAQARIAQRHWAKRKYYFIFENYSKCHYRLIESGDRG